MLRIGSSLKGYEVEASDGGAGSVQDLLFDDITWKLRWMVVDTGDWLNRRRVLIHPSVIGMIDDVASALQIKLARATIAEAPGILLDRPVSLQYQKNLYDYYDWDAAWDGSTFGQGTMFSGLEPVMHFDRDTVGAAAGEGFHVQDGDPHLRSLSEIIGYHIHANDGDIGHAQDVVIDDISWLINYLIVDTSNWWVGQHVLLSPYSVTNIEFPERKIRVNTTVAKIRSSPLWKPEQLIDEDYQAQLHEHYGWPAY